MTPLDRAARAEYLAHRYGSPEAAARAASIAFWDAALPEFRAEKIRCMRAALATLTEPTEEMIQAGERELDGSQGQNHNVESAPIWQAMLKKVIDP